MQAREALPSVREAGIANMAAGVFGLASLYARSFVSPVAISEHFYGVAGVCHAGEQGRSSNDRSLFSDLFLSVAPAAFIGSMVLYELR